MGNIEEMLKEKGIIVPAVANPPAAKYVPYKVVGNIVTISGQLPAKDGELQFIGQLGKDISVEDGQACARICGLNIIAQLREACGGDLNKVKQCIRLGIFVNSTPDFTQQPAVGNGASELMQDVFGEAGEHARSAFGVAQLPFGVAVEVEGQFEIV